MRNSKTNLGSNIIGMSGIITRLSNLEGIGIVISHCHVLVPSRRSGKRMLEYGTHEQSYSRVNFTSTSGPWHLRRVFDTRSSNLVCGGRLVYVPFYTEVFCSTELVVFSWSVWMAATLPVMSTLMSTFWVLSTLATDCFAHGYL